MKELRIKLKKDERYLQVHERVVGMRSKLDFNALQRELFTMQATRDTRNLRYDSLLQDQQKRLIEAELQNGAYRSRCCEIQMGMLRYMSDVDELVDNLRGYVSAHYRTLIETNVKTLTERKTIVSDTLLPCYKGYSDAKRVYDIAALMIEDLTSAGWNLKRIADVLAIRQRDI